MTHTPNDTVPPAIVETPPLPLACFSGRLEHLLDQELRARWHQCAKAVADGHVDPRAAARAVADRATYLDEMDRRGIAPPTQGALRSSIDGADADRFDRPRARP